MYDVIIIGKGPAGISASLYTVRAGLKTLVIAKGDSVLAKADKIDNYYGFEASISGKELLSAGERQAKRLGVEFADDEIFSFTTENGMFTAKGSKDTYTGKSTLLATGQPIKSLNIINLKDFEGKGVSYCSTCDGFFYRNLRVGVLGNKDFAVNEAMELKAFTKDITIFTNGFKPEISKKFEEEAASFKYNNKKVKKIDGTEFLEKIYFDDGDSVEIDGLFVAYERASSVDFARKIGIETDKDSIAVNKEQQTNIEGLFAAGDCTGGFKQISTSVGQGAIAGKNIIDYVRKINKLKG